MRILVTGFVVFALWSALSTYLYVCKIRGLCFEPISLQIDTAANVLTADKNPSPLKVMIPENLTIYFAFDKSNFTADASSDKYFSKSDSFLNQNLQARISITGHTDAIGSDAYNQALGFRRAQTMQQYFEAKGIKSNKIVIDSKGEKEPASDNNTKDGRAANRRAIITINK
jgi:outer membrane protein OmpA-like peptidoglycan-associated protein